MSANPPQGARLPPKESVIVATERVEPLGLALVVLLGSTALLGLLKDQAIAGLLIVVVGFGFLGTRGTLRARYAITSSRVLVHRGPRETSHPLGDVAWIDRERGLLADRLVLHFRSEAPPLVVPNVPNGAVVAARILELAQSPGALRSRERSSETLARLKGRLARGEIGVDHYRRAREALRASEG